MSHKKVTKLILPGQLDMAQSLVELTPNFASTKRCMYCTLSVPGKVVGCPIHLISEHVDIKHNDKRSADEYVTYGVFCSYNCAKAYALTKEHDPTFTNSSKYLSIMVMKEYGTVVNVIPSPPIELMSAYGGYMTNEQYRTEIGKVRYVSNGTTIMHPLTLVYTRC
jgi:hypothetical protein